MRVGTWNVEYARGAEKNRRRLELIRRANADVWVLTETHDELSLEPSYRCASSTPRPDKPGGRWVTIWSRLPPSRVLATSDPCRTAAVLLPTSRRPLIVYGTVMPWGADRGPLGTARFWSEHHRVIPEQGADWAMLRAGTPGALLCVAGDYNTTLGGPGYGTRQGRAALEEALRANKLTCVTREEHRSDRFVDGPYIDHIAISDEASAGAAVVESWQGVQDGMRLSDHPAVVVEIPAVVMD